MRSIISLTIFLLFFILSWTSFATATTYETEPNNEKTTANPLVSGEGMVGQLSSRTDEDWFSISTSGAAVIDVLFTEIETSPSVFWSISVLNSSGDVLGGMNHRGSDTSTQFSTAIAEAGTYYVKIVYYSFWSDKTYTLTVTPKTTTLPITTYETEPNNEKTTANPLVSGEGMVGQLSSRTDEDWFSISTSGAAVIDVLFTEIETSPSVFWSISVLNSSGDVLGGMNHRGSDTSTQFSTAIAEAGTYYVKIVYYSFWSDKTYTLTVTPKTTTLPITTYETEPNNEKTTANPLVSGEGMVGQLSSRTDEDWFSISTSGAAVIDVLFTEIETSPSVFWSISVLNSSGDVLGGMNHRGSDTSTQFSTAVAEAGTYYVKIVYYSYWSDKTYTLTVTFPTASCPDCFGVDVVLENVTFTKDLSCECIATTSITIGTGVTIESEATVTFMAPTVKLQKCIIVLGRIRLIP